MKKFTALTAGVLLLSSSLAVGCGQSASPRTGKNVNNTGRVQDIGRTTNLNPRVATTNTLRNDRTLEARVETIPGIKKATVLVIGDTAYVGINQGTNAPANTNKATNNTTSYRGVTPGPAGGTTMQGAYTGQAGTTGTTGTYGPGYRAGTYGVGGAGALPNTGTYGATWHNAGVLGYGNGGAGIMSGTAGGGTYALDTNRPGYANYYNSATRTYGTAGTAGNTTGIAGNAGKYGTNGIATPNPYGVHGTHGTYGHTSGNVVTNNNAANRGTTGNTGVLNNNMGISGNVGTYGVGTTQKTIPNYGKGTTTNNVGTYGTNANENVNADVKARVTAAVKQANPAIKNVYVSANPALMDRMGAFVRETATGHPVRGVNDLLDTLRRMFPATR